MSITQNVSDQKLHYNNFNLSHTHDTSGRIGKLIPVLSLPVVAGELDTIKQEFNLRLSPLAAPAMARFNVHFHAFYVPYRILTPRSGQETTWEKFVSSVTLASEDIPEGAKLPYVATSSPIFISGMKESGLFSHWNIGSLNDYLGLPVITNPSTTTASGSSALFYINSEQLRKPGFVILDQLAYLKIWNDWYRRDQIEDEVIFPLDLGVIDYSVHTNSQYTKPEMPLGREDEPWNISDFIFELFKLRTRNYERDYFTSALPEPQAGDDVLVGGGRMSVMNDAYLSLTSSNSRLTISNPSVTTSGTGPSFLGISSGKSLYLDTKATVASQSSSSPYSEFSAESVVKDINGSNSYIYGDFSVRDVDGIAAVPFSINELRMAMQLQGVRERINRGGTRYLEIMKSIHGVTVSDLRLQRPQYLGGIKSPISIGAVVQTSESDSTPQGTLTGIGSSVGGNTVFRTKRIFEEDGVVMVIMSVTPRTGYYGGVPRKFMKHDILDYYHPQFDHLGEQETYRAELKFSVTNHDDANYNSELSSDADPALGYNPRYEEYKASYSTVSGEFRKSLDNWHVMRAFNQAPVLSPDFIHAEPEDFDHLFEFENIENTSNEHFQANLYFEIKSKRPMSKYSTPFTFY